MDMFTSRDEVIKELREEIFLLRSTVKLGVPCPVCDQNCKVYWRSIYGKMATTLINLYWLTLDAAKGFKEFHITKFYKGGKDGGFSGGGDFQKLVHWGLVEPAEEMREGEPPKGKGKSEGFWKMTQPGMAFVVGNLSVPKYVRIYNSEFLGFGGDKTVNIKDVKGKDFNYVDLMSR